VQLSTETPAATDSVYRMSQQIVPIPPNGGSAQWGEAIGLRDGGAEEVVLDLGKLTFADPLLLARMCGFIDLNCAAGRKVQIVPPQAPLMRSYLEWMHLAADLPAGCSSDLSTLDAPGSSKILIPVRRLRSTNDVVDLEQELGDLYLAHFEGPVARLAEAFTRTVGEISDNATTHGRSPVGGSYVAAQRYSQNGQQRCVLVVGDLGIGIPAHMRKAFPELKDDGDAIRVATLEGTSGTGDPQRGIGYQYVIDGLKSERIASGDLHVWSGRGRFRIETRNGTQGRRRAWSIDEPTSGTWVRLELVSQ
jgi:hypothetical protein